MHLVYFRIISKCVLVIRGWEFSNWKYTLAVKYIYLERLCWKMCFWFPCKFQCGVWFWVFYGMLYFVMNSLLQAAFSQSLLWTWGGIRKESFSFFLVVTWQQKFLTLLQFGFLEWGSWGTEPACGRGRRWGKAKVRIFWEYLSGSTCIGDNVALTTSYLPVLWDGQVRFTAAG